MSIKIMTMIWESGPEKQGHLLVMLALADYASDVGECWPSIKSIAQKARMTERGVQKIIRVLEDEGWLKIDTGNGRKGCNQYTINPERCSPPEPRSPRTRVHKTPNDDAETPNKSAVNPEPRSPEPLEPSLTVIEPSFGETPDPPSRKKTSRATQLPDGWVPSDRNVQDATDRNFSAEEIHHEANQFRDHHLARGNSFKDWDAAWRTWLGNARKFSRGRVMVGSSASPGYGRGRSIASVVAQRRIDGQN